MSESSYSGSPAVDSHGDATTGDVTVDYANNESATFNAQGQMTGFSSAGTWFDVDPATGSITGDDFNAGDGGSTGDDSSDDDSGDDDSGDDSGDDDDDGGDVGDF